MKMVLEKEVILGIVLLQTFIEMAPMKLLVGCPKDNYIIVDSKGIKQGCFHCHSCHEGSGLHPPCGSKITDDEKKNIRCVSCVDGETYSDEYGPSRCKPCSICHKKEIVPRKCTAFKDALCSGKCEKGYYYDNLTTHGCEECSYCCNDNKDIRINECKDMPDNRHCSMLRKQECSPTEIVTKTTAGPLIPPNDKDRTPNPVKTKSNSGLTTNEIIVIGIVIALVLIIIVVGGLCFRFWWIKRRSESSNTSTSTREPETVPLNPTTCSTCENLNQFQSLSLQVKTVGEIREGQAVDISCILGDVDQKHLKFSWKKDDQEIKDGNNNNTPTLSFKEIKVLDFGCYACHVRCKKTEHSSSSISGEVSVDVLPCEGRSYRRLDNLCSDFEACAEEELVLALAPDDKWKPVALHFGMKKRYVDLLEANAKDGHKEKSAQDTLLYLFATFPDITVYDLLKCLRKHKNQDNELIGFLCQEEHLYTKVENGTSRTKSDNKGDIAHVCTDEKSNLEHDETNKQVDCTRHTMGRMRIKKSECIFCGIEKSLDTDILTRHKQKISDVLKLNWGKRRQDVTGDGHCIIHAFILCLEEAGYSETCDVQSLLDMIKSEILDNLNFYGPFVAMSEPDQLTKELEDYIRDKRYDSGVCDLILPVLMNITKTSALVFSVFEESVRCDLIYPPAVEVAERNIFLSKVGQHYDAVLNDEDEMVDDHEVEKPAEEKKRPRLSRSDSTTSYESSI